MMISIPLGVRVFDIKVSKSFPDQETMYRREPKSPETSYMISIIYIVLMIGIAFGTYYYIKKTVYKEKNEYLARVNKILKEYDDRIVTVSNFIRYDKIEIENVPIFKIVYIFLINLKINYILEKESINILKLGFQSSGIEYYIVI